MQQRRGTPLPAPTPTELAAVRALVDGHRGHPTSRWVTVLSVLLGLGSAGLAVVGLSGQDVGRSFDQWFPWLLAAAAAVSALNARDSVVQLRRHRRRVAARLGVTGAAARPVRRPVLSTFEQRALVGCLVVDGALLATAVLLADRGPWWPNVWVFLVAAVSGMLAASAVALLRDPLVGDGVVVREVDAAIRRRQLSGVAAAALPLLLAAAWADPAALVPWAFTALGVTGCCLVAAWFLRQDDLLLRDPRLADAPEPEQWLAGAAA